VKKFLTLILTSLTLSTTYLLANQPTIEFIEHSDGIVLPFLDHILEEKFFNLTHHQKLQYHLARKGYTLKQSYLEDLPKNRSKVRKAYTEKEGSKSLVAKVLCNNHPFFLNQTQFAAIPKKKKAVILWEPPLIIPAQYTKKILSQYDTIFTFRDDLVNNVNIHKFYHPVLKPMTDDRPPFDQKKLSCMIIGNKRKKGANEIYSLRRSIIDFYEKKTEDQFSLYGRGWEKEKLKSYQGSVGCKIATMKQYKFAYCLENSRDIPGYISEKIFDCFAAGVVPIYRGANNITKDIPAECFIDMRDFRSIEEIDTYISQMTEPEHNEHIVAIQEFLQSTAAKRFSEEYFVQHIASRLLE